MSLSSAHAEKCFSLTINPIPKDFPKLSLLILADSKIGNASIKDMVCEIYPHPRTALFVLIDQTVGFSKDFAERSLRKIISRLKPGNFIEVISFSSSVRGHYTKIAVKGMIDPNLSEDLYNRLPIKYIKLLKILHKKQILISKAIIAREARKVFQLSNRSIPKSEIVTTLKEVSNYIRNFKADKKIVLIISDMLENSDITSFYYKGHIRKINPLLELKKIKKAGFLSDFGGATVYVIGLGYYWKGESGKRESYLGGEKLMRLKKFWELYFTESNAKVGEIGTPLILGEIY